MTPELHRWKPLGFSPSVRPLVYAAGKIHKSRTDWRPDCAHQIGGCIEGWDGCTEYGANDAQDLTDLVCTFHASGIVANYVGPYSIGCDHGCFHGPATHGALSTIDNPERQERVRIIRRSLVQIDRCDLFFAWLGGDDGETAHGTLVELGYARAEGKFVAIGTDRPIREMWFAEQLSDFVFEEAHPHRAMEAAISKWRVCAIKRGVVR